MIGALILGIALLYFLGYATDQIAEQQDNENFYMNYAR